MTVNTQHNTRGALKEWNGMKWNGWMGVFFISSSPFTSSSSFVCVVAYRWENVWPWQRLASLLLHNFFLSSFFDSLSWTNFHYCCIYSFQMRRHTTAVDFRSVGRSVGQSFANVSLMDRHVWLDTYTSLFLFHSPKVLFSYVNQCVRLKTSIVC